MEKLFICLDVGGTEIKGAALRAHESQPRAIRHYSAQGDGNLEQLTRHFTRIILELAGEAPNVEIASVRLAFPGPFDYVNGICLLEGLAKFDALFGVNLRDVLSGSLREAATPRLADGFDICFANDVAAFALGELHFGGAQNTARSLFICIGTGCGSAFGIGQALADEDTPHVPANGYIYNQSFRGGCIDDFISKRGLCGLSTEYLGEPLDGHALARRAYAGDSAAADCFAAFGHSMREAFSPFLAAYRPDVLVLGGQLMRSADLFLAPLQAECETRSIRLHLAEDTSLRTIQGLLTISSAVAKG